MSCIAAMRLNGIADRGISSGLRLILAATKRTPKSDFRSALSDSSIIMGRRAPVGRSEARLQQLRSPGLCSQDGRLIGERRKLTLGV
jgi:hypothetical protein